MLEGLDNVPWAELEHAYGSAEDVPDLLRALLDPNPITRSGTIQTLYGNVFHQGSRYPATPYVIPFLIQMCSTATTPARGELLFFWKSLIGGYFTVQERPIWGDGQNIYFGDEVQDTSDWGTPFANALHQIYSESIKGLELLLSLLEDSDFSVRATSAGVLACLRTVAEKSAPQLEKRLSEDPNGWVRAATAFALGELRIFDPLRRILANDTFAAARCMAACELARFAPDSSLIAPLMQFVVEPIDGYDRIPGAGGKSTGDAAYSISLLSKEMQWQAAPVISERLTQSRSFDTVPLVGTLLSSAFELRAEPLKELNDAQRFILSRLVNSQELWRIGNLASAFPSYGIPFDRRKCAELAGVTCADDIALAALSTGVLFSKMGFLDKGREHIEKALQRDPQIFDRTPSPDECWLYCAKAYAETDPKHALVAFRRAIAINRGIFDLVDSKWYLSQLIEDER